MKSLTRRGRLAVTLGLTFGIVAVFLTRDIRSFAVAYLFVLLAAGVGVGAAAVIDARPWRRRTL